MGPEDAGNMSMIFWVALLVGFTLIFLDSPTFLKLLKKKPKPRSQMDELRSALHNKPTMFMAALKDKDRLGLK